MIDDATCYAWIPLMMWGRYVVLSFTCTGYTREDDAKKMDVRYSMARVGP